jgi:uncharacterized protein (DUF885 family)
MKSIVRQRRASLRLASALAIAAAIVPAISRRAYAGAPTPSAQRAIAPAPRGDAAFRKAVAAFIDSEMRIFPERATAEGDHRFDTRVNDLSTAGIAAVVRHASKWKRTFEDFDRKSLSPNNEADREWLVARCDGELLWRREVRSYERDPGMYLPTSAIFSLIQRDFAPAEDRMKSVTARERAALANLGAARANLAAKRTPPVAIAITLEQMPATISFFKNDLPTALASVPDGPTKAAFDSANAAEIAALESYRDWLQDNLRPRASGDYAIGADA